jgi:hypothetical protein
VSINYRPLGFSSTRQRRTARGKTLPWQRGCREIGRANHLPEPIFTVRMLKYGTNEVVMKRDLESATKHIGDFRSRDEALTWITENAASWRRNLPHRR